VRSLRSSSRIRRLALDMLAGKPPSTIQPLLDVLATPSPPCWKECTVAAWMLGYLSPPPEQQSMVTERLCQVLDNPQDKTGRLFAKRSLQRIVKALPLSGALGLMITLAFLIASLLEGALGTPRMEHGIGLVIAFFLGVTVYAVVCSPFVLPLSAAYDRKRINRVRAAAATALGRVASPESVGALARAASDKSASVRKAAQAALLQALPTLTPEHYGRAGSETVSHLCKVLRKAEPPLALAILEALVEIGDGSAVATIEWLVQRGNTEKVREAARGLLPILWQRREEENAPKMLLRASTSTECPSGVLLRPAKGHTTTEVEQLLRAGPIE
jgi:hypothetical protein